MTKHLATTDDPAATSTAAEDAASPPWEQRLLIFLLRFSGCVLLLAFPCVFLPSQWMASTHAWLGLGEFPDTVLVDYLSRSLAALYGFHGCLLLLVSRDVRRFQPILIYIAMMNFFFGCLVIGIDLHAGLPWFWTLMEGPPLVAMGVLMWFLQRRLGRP